MAKLSVHLVAWNGERYIPFLFESLAKQTYKDWELVILDNGSTDGTRAALKNAAEKLSVPIQFIESKENFGFAGGHNKLYRETDSEYMLLLNQDMYLTEACLEHMVSFLDTHQDVAAVSPRLMRWDFGAIDDSNLAGEKKLAHSFTDHIDSLGLKVFRNRRVIEKYTKKKWSEVEHKMRMSFRAERWRGESALEVFGVSGAFPMLRRSAIDKVAFSNGDFFDGEYHSYKEDVDLAFRLRLNGQKAFVLLDTVAYHDRSGAGPAQLGDTAAGKNKKDQSSWVRYHSYKNHLMTLYKNEYGRNALLDFFPILWYEVKKFVWHLLFDRSVLKGLKEVWSSRASLKERRAEITGKRVSTAQDIRDWWRT